VSTGEPVTRYATLSPVQHSDEDALTPGIIELASQYRHYEYHRITALLQRAGRQVGKNRVERIWRREGLNVRWDTSRRRRKHNCAYRANSIGALHDRYR